MADSSTHPEIRPQQGELSAPDSGAKPSTTLAWGLGQREREVLSVLWSRGSANVQQVAERLSTALAYTTVMTTLDRLFKKGLLQREKKDRAFIYSAHLTAREIEEQRASDLVRRFFSDSGERPDILLSCLVDAVHHYDTGMLDQLESKIRSARAQHLAANPEPDGGS
jgi:predicted transcriptional regulator